MNAERFFVFICTLVWCGRELRRRDVPAFLCYALAPVHGGEGQGEGADHLATARARTRLQYGLLISTRSVLSAAIRSS